jgi:two-component system CheB/CheR fusion protein
VARVYVRDDGIGMDPGFLPHIFELFVQEPRTLERASGGLGLGLALVKLAVEAHGGNVTASSPGRGQGSEFVVALPHLPESHQAASPVSVFSAPSPAAGRRRILVVDDEEDAANALAEVLTIQGHESLVAHDGLAAVEMARSFRPEVVLLDIGLPLMDGYEVARRLRQELGDERILLVALTGYRKDATRIEQAGFDRHLIKPPDMRKLFAWLAALDGNLSS